MAYLSFFHSIYNASNLKAFKTFFQHLKKKGFVKPTFKVYLGEKAAFLNKNNKLLIEFQLISLKIN